VQGALHPQRVPASVVEGSVMSERIEVTVAEGRFSAYLARPSQRHAPVVIVVQEMYGVNADIRGMCDELAEHGYIAIAPDLFWRKYPGLDLNSWSEAESSEALEICKSYDVDEGVHDIAATVEIGRSIKGASGKVAVMGFCLGGLMAFLTAARSTVDAAVDYYGEGTESYLAEAGAVQVPMLIHLAEEDEFMSKDAQARITGAFAGSSYIKIYSYLGCNHAFARQAGKHYDVSATLLASERTLAFLSLNLR
jgi:carboxymethylenebutenolidase